MGACLEFRLGAAGHLDVSLGHLQGGAGASEESVGAGGPRFGCPSVAHGLVAALHLHNPLAQEFFVSDLCLASEVQLGLGLLQLGCGGFHASPQPSFIGRSTRCRSGGSLGSTPGNL